MLRSVPLPNRTDLAKIKPPRCLLLGMGVGATGPVGAGGTSRRLSNIVLPLALPLTKRSWNASKVVVTEMPHAIDCTGMGRAVGSNPTFGVKATSLNYIR